MPYAQVREELDKVRAERDALRALDTTVRAYDTDAYEMWAKDVEDEAMHDLATLLRTLAEHVAKGA